MHLNVGNSESFKRIVSVNVPLSLKLLHVGSVVFLKRITLITSLIHLMDNSNKNIYMPGTSFLVAKHSDFCVFLICHYRSIPDERCIKPVDTHQKKDGRLQTVSNRCAALMYANDPLYEYLCRSHTKPSKFIFFLTKS
jgi:hypothetical protein